MFRFLFKRSRVARDGGGGRKEWMFVFIVRASEITIFLVSQILLSFWKLPICFCFQFPAWNEQMEISKGGNENFILYQIILMFFLNYQGCNADKWILTRFLATPDLWVFQPRVQYMCGDITNLGKQAERVKSGIWGFQSNFLLNFLDVPQVLITVGWTLLVVVSILPLWPQMAHFLLGVSLFAIVFFLNSLEHLRWLEPKKAMPKSFFASYMFNELIGKCFSKDIWIYREI